MSSENEIQLRFELNLVQIERDKLHRMREDMIIKHSKDAKFSERKIKGLED